MTRFFHSILVLLDREEVRAFQGMYYIAFTAGAAILLVVPGADTGPVDDMLGPHPYLAWVLMNLVCPPLTLLGRRLTTISAQKPAGEPNSAWGAAWLQLVGDFGVWSGVNIFVYEMFRYDAMWWLKDVYVGLFLLMGVLGGSMFTFRSVRRLVAIKRRVLDEQRQDR